MNITLKERLEEMKENNTKGLIRVTTGSHYQIGNYKISKVTLDAVEIIYSQSRILIPFTSIQSLEY